MNNLHIPAVRANELNGDGAVLVDVRETIETENVWIDKENIVKIPFSEFVERGMELPKNQTLILCCAVGLVSEKAAGILRENGYESVFVLENGLVGWKDARLPLKTIEEVNCKCKCCNEIA